MMNHSVLLVDDDSEVRHVLRGWAHASGFAVREAGDADEALDRLASAPSQVAVCDINMPGRNGIWLAGEIRQRHPDTAVVMATAQHDVDTVVGSLQAGVVDYLLKPFDSRRLMEALCLGLEWHEATVTSERLHDTLEYRLRDRRAQVAAAVAEIQATEGAALDGLLQMLTLHERDGKEHAHRVARLAVSVAVELGLAGETTADVQRGALLHDIGKINMPLRILQKPAPLDDEEWDVMRTHPQVGHDLLQQVPALAAAAEIVLTSHEAFDGTGYPRGLAGEAIPLGARILSVADSYDSMTRPHTQRPAMPSAMALLEIARCRGTQFDPRVVDALMTVLGTQ